MLLNSVCDSEICDWSQSFYTSKRLNQTPGCDNQSFEINNRAIIAMREIGTALITFCGFLNMPSPMQIKSFNEMQQNIASVYQDSMQSASNQLHNMANVKFGQKNEMADILVFCNRTWQRRGFSSLNEVVTVIASDTGKCVDYQVKSKQCASCVHHGSLEKVLSMIYMNSSFLNMTVISTKKVLLEPAKCQV